ncbi:MAG: ATP-binding cassette domain-containing protein [Myxococcota bacterium]
MTTRGALAGPPLSLRAATKRYGSVTAVAGLDLDLLPGRIHALVGENGAGKSTALKMLAGYVTPTSGDVYVDGRPLTPLSPRRAMSLGVGMVHQHFMLVPPLSGLENLVLGCEPTRAGGRLDLERARREAEALQVETGLTVPLDPPVRNLSVGEQQRLEILRVLYRGARAILLDEPTAVLSPVEVEELYRTLGRIRDRGATIAVVTHRLDEVVRFCDELTVMRRGRRALSEMKRIDEPGLADRLTRAIMGHEVAPPAVPSAVSDDAPVGLAVVEATALRPDGRRGLDRLSCRVRAGEIVGIAGVEGNGQTELARALAGLMPLASGWVELRGKRLDHGTGDPARAVQRRRDAGLVVVHEDRHRDEMILETSVAENLVLGDLGRLPDAEPDTVARRFGIFDVRPPDPEQLGGALSGGNQQKVVMARHLDRPLVALVAAQPTRGVDIGTARIIRAALAERAAAGAAVVVISADLNELRGLSHRLLVLRQGRIVAELPPTASEQTIGQAMLGHTGPSSDRAPEIDDAAATFPGAADGR